MKILYAANNSESSSISLKRFLDNLNKSHTIKIAAYKKATKYVKIDYLLDSLHNIFSPKEYGLNNENLQLYTHEIKNFNPDLIISDLEYYTSYVANYLNIKLCQCSPYLLNYALPHKYKYQSGVFKHYIKFFNNGAAITEHIKSLIHNSDKNYVYSNFGDLIDAPQISDNFEWIRPYHKIGRKSQICEHNIIASLPNNDKSILNVLKKYNDVVVFSDFIDEQYRNIVLKRIELEDEYYCNLHNSNIFICNGEINLLADAFYNEKYSIIFPNFNEPDCLLNSIFSDFFGSGKIIFNRNDDISKYVGTSVVVNANNIKYLHEKIEEL